MKKEKGIDDIFKRSLQDPVNEPDFAEHSWDAFENMLDSKTGTGATVRWLRYLSAAAAVIIIAFCWWMFKPAQTITPQNVVKNKINSQPAIIDAAGAQQTQVVVKNQNDTKKTINNTKTTIEPKSNTADRNQPVKNIAKINQSRSDKADDLVVAAGDQPVTTGVVMQPDAGILTPGNIIIAAQPSINLVNPVDVSALQIRSVDALVKLPPGALAANKTPAVKKVSTSALRPQFALTVLASPELNGIGSLKSASRGNNIGLMFTIGVKRFTLSTGANYTVKPYSLPYSQYPSSYSYRNAPETVTADCRMLDIPINLGYQLFNKSGNKLMLGTGLSSYIMTHETYTYDYAASAKKVYGPSFYAVEGKGKYLFSIMNLQATYERKINSKFGLSLQPYFKVPLSEIGYSRVRVQTFGVALGVNWNINALTKPK